MSEIKKPQHGVGSLVYVLSHHRDWGTPQLTLTLVMGIYWSQGEIYYRFSSLDELHVVDEIYSVDLEGPAHIAYMDADEKHKKSRR